MCKPTQIAIRTHVHRTHYWLFCWGATKVCFEWVVGHKCCRSAVKKSIQCFIVVELAVRKRCFGWAFAVFVVAVVMRRYLAEYFESLVQRIWGTVREYVELQLLPLHAVQYVFHDCDEVLATISHLMLDAYKWERQRGGQQLQHLQSQANRILQQIRRQDAGILHSCCEDVTVSRPCEQKEPA